MSSEDVPEIPDLCLTFDDVCAQDATRLSSSALFSALRCKICETATALKVCPYMSLRIRAQDGVVYVPSNNFERGTYLKVYWHGLEVKDGAPDSMLRRGVYRTHIQDKSGKTLMTVTSREH